MIILKGDHDREYLVNPAAISHIEHSVTNDFGRSFCSIYFTNGKRLSVQGRITKLAEMIGVATAS